MSLRALRALADQTAARTGRAQGVVHNSLLGIPQPGWSVLEMSALRRRGIGADACAYTAGGAEDRTDAPTDDATLPRIAPLPEPEQAPHHRTRWSRERVLEALRTYRDANGRLPNSNALIDEPSLPVPRTVATHLGAGTLREALQIAERALPPLPRDAPPPRPPPRRRPRTGPPRPRRSTLEGRNQEILARFRAGELTDHELADRYSLSNERIVQILKQGGVARAEILARRARAATPVASAGGDGRGRSRPGLPPPSP